MSLSTTKPLVPAIVTHHREMDTIPTIGLLATLGVAVPIFATTVLPLSITYQLGLAGLEAVLGRRMQKPWSYQDSDLQVSATQRKALDQRAYDVVILGATGFTGGLAVRYLVQTYGVDGKKVKYAIAGRSQRKLDAVKSQLAKELNNDGILQIPTLIVDTTKPDTMPTLCADTRVVATTAGPYSTYGSLVVECCAKYGTHYVDITGEVDWVKHMALQYQGTAKATGAKIVPFCGHDSIPWDCLVMRLQDTLAKECKGDKLQRVTFWDTFKGDFAGGTLATFVTGFEGRLAEPPQTDLDVFQRTADGKESEFKLQRDLPAMPERATSPWDAPKQRWTVPFFMADVNSDVVAWSHALRESGCKQLMYTEKWVLPDFSTAATTYAWLLMTLGALLNPLTLGLAKRFLFTQPGDGPSLQAMEEKHYLQISAEGVGEQGNRVEGMLYFPKDTGCLETTRMLMESALALALESDALPKRSGGFWSPSTAMGNVLVQRILDTGSTLDVRVIPATTKE